MNKVQRNELSRNRLQRIWYNMRTRCSNPKHNRYKFYGGRGITVCNEWDNSFQAFYNWATNNGYADNLSIDRIDSNGNYEPSNCRWATQKEQQNNRTDNHIITYNGKTQNLTQWGIETGIDYHTLLFRLQRGWSIEKTLTTPTRRKPS